MHVCMCTMSKPGAHRGQCRSTGFSGTRVNHGFGCWELNPGPLQEQPMFLTTEQSPKPCAVLFTWQGGYNTRCHPVVTTLETASNWINQSFSWILSVQRKKRESSDCRAWSESYFRKPMFSTLPHSFHSSDMKLLLPEFVLPVLFWFYVAPFFMSS